MGELTDEQRQARARALALAQAVIAAEGTKPFLPDGSPNPEFTETPAYAAATDRPWEALGRGLAHLGTAGFSENVLGGMAVVSGRSPDGSGYGDYSDPSASYTAMRDRARFDLAESRESHPGAVLTGEVLGGALMGWAAAPKMVAQTFRQAVRQTARTGAVEGGLLGLGTSDADSWGGLLQGGGQGALLGGLLGPGAYFAATGLRAAVDPLVGMAQAIRGLPYEGRAARALTNTFRRAGMTPAEARRLIEEAGAEGQDMFVTADALGNSGQRALAGVARQPGDGRTEIADFLRQRQLDQADRVAGFVSDGLDINETASQANRRLTDVRGQEADTLWGAARQGAGPVDTRGAVAAIDSRLGPMQGSGVSGGSFDNLLASYRNRLTAANPPDGATRVDLSDFSRVHEIKRDLADDIEEAVRRGRNNEAAMLRSISRELDKAMEQSSEAYRFANDRYADRSRVIEAVDQGQEASRLRASDVADTYRGLPPAQQGPVQPGALPLLDAPDAFRTGYGDVRLGAIERGTPGRNAALPFTSTQNSEIMGLLSNDPALFQRRIGREMTMAETNLGALGGSRTADNLADQVDMNGGNQVMGLLSQFATGGVRGVAADAMRALGSAGTGLNEETRALISRVLLSRDPDVQLQRLIDNGALAGNELAKTRAFLRQFGYAAADQRLPQ